MTAKEAFFNSLLDAETKSALQYPQLSGFLSVNICVKGPVDPV
jgi:hypothetical protein